MGEPPCFNCPIDDAVAYLALGSNVGDRAANLRRAVASIRELGEVQAVSRVYESAAVGYRDQGPFYNLVLRVRTALSPEALFARVKRIEREMGRTASFRNAPRVIDIDILTYDDFVLHTPELEIPHPRMHERSFVLLPLAEVAPDFVHPRTRRSMKQLVEDARKMEPAVPIGFIDEMGESQ